LSKKKIGIFLKIFISIFTFSFIFFFTSLGKKLWQHTGSNLEFIVFGTFSFFLAAISTAITIRFTPFIIQLIILLTIWVITFYLATTA
jgi:hypothetical protein